MIDADAFAALLCDWCLGVQPDQQVLVAGPPLAEPLMRGLHGAILQRRAWPLLRMQPSWLAEDFQLGADDRQLDAFAPLELVEMESIDAHLGIIAPANTRALSGVDPERLARAAAARRPILEERLAGPWCGTIWPTAALAQQAGMSERDYEAFIARALFLDRPDPIEAWRQLSARQAQLVEHLRPAREIRIEADGTDLRLRVDDRVWINSDGKHNMPSGEVFTGPLENSANGTIRFTIPSNPGGVEVEGIELTFRDGEVVAHRADRGLRHLQAALATDAGARYLGELGIGTNPGIDRATGSILLDEKMAGTVHLALGRSYPETGGRNTSALHWDIVCDLRDGGRLSADDQVLNDKVWAVG